MIRKIETTQTFHKTFQFNNSRVSLEEILRKGLEHFPPSKK